MIKFEKNEIVPAELAVIVETAYRRVEAKSGWAAVELFIDHLSSTTWVLLVDAERYAGVFEAVLGICVEGRRRVGLRLYVQTLFAEGSDRGELSVLVESFEEGGLWGGEWRRDPRWESLLVWVASLGGEVVACGHETKGLCLQVSLPAVRFGLEEFPRPLLHGSLQRWTYRIGSGSPFMRAVLSEQLGKFGLLEAEGVPDLLIWNEPIQSDEVMETHLGATLEAGEWGAFLLLGRPEWCWREAPSKGRILSMGQPIFKFKLLAAVNALLSGGKPY